MVHKTITVSHVCSCLHDTREGEEREREGGKRGEIKGEERERVRKEVGLY